MEGLIYIVTVLLLVFEKSRSQHHVCLSKDEADGNLNLTCSVDDLKLDINFYHRDKNVIVGSCAAPTPESFNTGPTCSCNCSALVETCKCNMLQNLSQRVTTLQIKDKNLSNIYGNWTCEHGSFLSEILVEPLHQPLLCNLADEKENEVKLQSENIGFWLTTVVLCMLLGALVAGCASNTDILARVIKRSLRLQEQISLVSNKTFSENCHTCDGPAVCAICVDCKHVYCDICCEKHTKYYERHSVCQVEHIFTSQAKVKCRQCSRRMATSVCTICLTVMCASCTEKHEHRKSEMKLLYQGPERIHRESEPVPVELEYMTKLSIEKKEKDDSIRVCGLAFLCDGRIAVVDSNNHRLTVFNHLDEHLKKEFDLKSEPRGLTHVSGMKLAITFAYEMEIRIYTVAEAEVTLERKMKISSLGLGNLKPFSIAYDQNHYAVEVGEGVDGMIVILDESGALKFRITNESNYAFFTGNTIRLALSVATEIENSRIFVSAMSKKTVSCISFRGQIVWSNPIPSPRGIIVVEKSTDKWVVMASRRCSVLFHLNWSDGKDEVLIPKGRIKSPRYIAYHQEKMLLCVQVEKNSKEDEFFVYKYNIKPATGNPEDEQEFLRGEAETLV